MFNKIKFYCNIALQKGERRMRRNEARLFLSKYPWINPDGMHIVHTDMGILLGEPIPVTCRTRQKGGDHEYPQYHSP